MDQGIILSEFQKEIEEIKIAALESEKAIEEKNSRSELNSNFQDQIFPYKKQEKIFDMSSSSDMDDIPKEQLVEDFVCAKIEACLEDDDAQMTTIFNGHTNIHDDVKNASDIGLLKKNNDCEVKNNVVVEVEELRSMEQSKFFVDLNENFDSSVSVPSSTSIIQLPPQSQLELIQLSHALENSDVYKVKNDSQDKLDVQTYGFRQHLMIGAQL
ncbi:hypothetical protein PIB30_037769 [Stylosanthes scabra]|uniref:Uncharacterized protein n=1 Tax=Stylosanthes scabra TaxID=79078 RepID=A0ABU6WH99_9FABA|nr:hypothetical protein [Stylosanthes scabra]